MKDTPKKIQFQGVTFAENSCISFAMRHEKVLTDRALSDVLRKFHRLGNPRSANAVDEILVEIVDRKTLEKIQVPEYIETLAFSLKISVEDLISSIVKCFVMEMHNGRTDLNKNIFAYIQEYQIPDDEKNKLLKYLIDKIGK